VRSIRAVRGGQERSRIDDGLQSSFSRMSSRR
jgi:hypothetical protein